MNDTRPKALILFTLLGFSSEMLVAHEIEEVLVQGTKLSRTSWTNDGFLDIQNSEYLSNYSVDSVEESVLYNPAIHFTQTGLSTQARIHGIGSGNSQGFEQSVGLFIDGISYPKAQLFRVPLNDLESVEIHYGPQNALFGKSSIAGALSVQTQRPSTEPFNEIAISAGNNGFMGANGVFNGPITRSAAGRFSFLLTESRGHIDNVFLGEEQPDEEIRSFRAQSTWKLPSSSLWLKMQHDTFDVKGRSKEIIRDLPSSRSLDVIAGVPGNPNLSSIPPTYSNILNTLFNQPSFEATETYNSQFNEPERSFNEVSNLVISSQHKLGSLKGTSTIGYLKYEYDELCDCDYIPSNLFSLSLKEHYDQFSFEYSLAGESSLVGFFLESSKQTFSDYFHAPADSLFGQLNIPISNTAVDRQFVQETSIAAFYGSMDFDLNRFGSVTLAARVSREGKQGTKSLDLIDPISAQAISNPTIICTYLVGLRVETRQSKGYPSDCNFQGTTNGYSTGHDVSEQFYDTSFSPSATYSKSISTDSKLYVNLKYGHKSGGLDPRSNLPDRFKFEGESTTYVDFGFKRRTNFSDLTAAVFRQEISDYQISQFDGGVGFNVGNADLVSSTGLDVSIANSWSTNLSTRLHGTLLNFEYDEFTNGSCYQGETPQSNSFCNYSGRDSHYAPHFKGGLGIDYLVGGDVEIHGQYTYIGSHNVHDNFDPKGQVGPYRIIDVSASTQVDNFKMSLIAKNITDEYVITYLGNVPLSGGFFGTNTHYGFLGNPRSILFEITVSL